VTEKESRMSNRIETVVTVDEVKKLASGYDYRFHYPTGPQCCWYSNHSREQLLEVGETYKIRYSPGFTKKCPKPITGIKGLVGVHQVHILMHLPPQPALSPKVKYERGRQELSLQCVRHLIEEPSNLGADVYPNNIFFLIDQDNNRFVYRMNQCRRLTKAANMLRKGGVYLGSWTLDSRGDHKGNPVGHISQPRNITFTYDAFPGQTATPVKQSVVPYQTESTSVDDAFEKAPEEQTIPDVLLQHGYAVDDNWENCLVCGKAVAHLRTKVCKEELQCEPMHESCYTSWKASQDASKPEEQSAEAPRSTQPREYAKKGQINIQLDPPELDLWKQVAAHKRVTVPDMVRNAVRDSINKKLGITDGLHYSGKIVIVRPDGTTITV
jgi:hypothetical protein